MSDHTGQSRELLWAPLSERQMQKCRTVQRQGSNPFRTTSPIHFCVTALLGMELSLFIPCLPDISQQCISVLTVVEPF